VDRNQFAIMDLDHRLRQVNLAILIEGNSSVKTVEIDLG
jgi:hypothetical protein